MKGEQIQGAGCGRRCVGCVRPFVFPGWILVALLVGGVEGSPGEPLSLFDLSAHWQADGGPGPFPFAGGPLEAGSETVRANGRRLARDLDYRITDAGHSITFLVPVPRGTVIGMRGRTAVQRIDLSARRRERPDGSPAHIFPREPAPPARVPPPSAGAANGLRVSGTKRIQIALGSAGEPSLTQSLRVDLSGEIARDVSVRAILSDRSVPVGAPGSTRSLEALDRVFFQIASPTVQAGLGDIEVRFDDTEFGRYHRQLQGANVAWETDALRVRAFGAVTPGRWHSERIVPREGYQGPYVLAVPSGIGQIVAGSERVHLDGQPLRRGDAQDYTIDYDRATVTFTPGRPIHADSRVTLSYQARDGSSGIRTVGVRGQTLTVGDRLRIGTTHLQESGRGDPLDRPGSSTPRRLSLVDAGFQTAGGLSVSSELALSGAADASTTGTALRVRAATGMRSLRVGSRGIGRARLDLGYRDVSPSFASLDRVQSVAEEGRWGWRPDEALLSGRIGEAALTYAPAPGFEVRADYGRRSGAIRASRDAVAARLERNARHTLRGDYSRIRQEGGTLLVHSGEAATRLLGLLPRVRYRRETATGAAIASSSLRYASGPFGGAFASPDAGVGSRDFGVELGTDPAGAAGWTSRAAWRATRVLDSAWRDSVRTFVHQHRVRVAGPRGVTLLGEASRSSVSGPGAPSGGLTTTLGQVRLSASPGGGAFTGQITYRISSTGVSDTGPVYLFVGEGRGAFLWEDVNGDGVRDREEFFPDSAGDYDAYPRLDLAYTPVRDARAGLHLSVDGGRLNRRPATARGRLLAGSAVDLWLESDRQAEPGGVSVAPWSMLAFEGDPSVRSARREMRTMLHLLRNRRAVTLRFENRFVDRLDRGLSEDGRVDEETLAVFARVRWGRRADFEVRVEDQNRVRFGSGPFAYRVDARSGGIRALFRVRQDWQAGIGLGLGRDLESLRGISADRVTIGPEFRRALPGRGRVTGGADWTRVVSEAAFPLFLGLAEGNRAGDTFHWRLGADTRFGRYVTAHLSYDGRKQPGRPVLHYGRMEMRATF